MATPLDIARAAYPYIGAAIVIISITAITVDIIDSKVDLPFIEQVQPFKFYDDFTPEAVILCQGTPIKISTLDNAIRDYNDHGWPTWPLAIERLVPCDSKPAPTGEVRIHSCHDLATKDGTLITPCDSTDILHEGATLYTFGDGDPKPPILSADIYLESATYSVLLHELGHAHGIVHSHTTDEYSIMAPHAGLEWRWMDRRPGGDWPYGDSNVIPSVP